MNYSGYFTDNKGNKYYPGIVESGSNSNGNYIKFADGTMICILNVKVTDQKIDTQYGNTNIYFGIRDWTFPAIFKSAPVVTCGCFRWSTGGSWGSVGPSSNEQVRLFGYDFYPRPSGEKCFIQAMAIGKWK